MQCGHCCDICPDGHVSSGLRISMEQCGQMRRSTAGMACSTSAFCKACEQKRIPCISGQPSDRAKAGRGMKSSIYDIHNAEDGCACSMVCQLFCQSASRGAGWCAGNSGQSVQSDRSIIACPHFASRPYLQLLGTVLEQPQHISVHDQPVTALRGGGWAGQRVLAGLDAAPHVHLHVR